MAQISRGYTFTDGGTGNAANLHSLVDGGAIQPGAIGDQANAAPDDADSFLVRQATSGLLKKCTLTQIKDSIPHDSPSGTAALRKLGTTSTMAAAGNDVRFPAPIHGVRKGNFGSPDTPAEPADISFATKTIVGTAIDWNDADVFYDTLAGNKTYTFLNANDGRSIQLIFKKNGHTVTLPATIGTVVVGSGTTFLHCFLTKTPGGITGLQIAI